MQASLCSSIGIPEPHPDGEVHFVLGGDEDGGDVLAGVAGDGQHDQAQEALVDARLLADFLDGARQEPAGIVQGFDEGLIKALRGM